MKKLLFITMLLGALYSMECEEWNAEYGTNYNCDCNQSTWWEYYYYSGGHMEGCWLYEANLYQANLRYADLSGANLSNAYIMYGDLSGANLTNANLSGAEFVMGGDLSGANLDGANLSNAMLGNVDLSGSNLSGADLSGASLYESDLTGADLSGASLYDAILIRADLTNANLCNLTASPSGDFCEELSGISDDNGDGYDDVSFDVGYNAGATSGDFNFDGILNVVDVIELVDKILND